MATTWRPRVSIRIRQPGRARLEGHYSFGWFKSIFGVVLFDVFWVFVGNHR